MTAKIEHARPGREPDEHRLHARWISRAWAAWVTLRARQREPGPAGVRRHSRSARRAAGRAEPLERRRFCPRCFKARRSTPTNRFRISPRPKEITPAAEARTRDFLKFLNERHLARHPGDSELARAHRQLRTGGARCSSAPPKSAIFRKESAATLELYGVNDANKTQGRLRAELPAGAAAARARRALRAALQRRLRDGRRRRQLGRAQETRRTIRRARADPRSTRRGAAARS